MAGDVNKLTVRTVQTVQLANQVQRRIQEAMNWLAQDRNFNAA
ncbi:hypothetical protein [Methylobacterium marchantiae]|uniref:Uncharacterized protein n=1 Tax=Methylobacterium marchantiae TaxID=600331 RepID=A0ABW3WXL2_9HYPH|nr:hypothetical protein AIGOOFII_1597 [Methylobacterium marchantiae]